MKSAKAAKMHVLVTGDRNWWDEQIMEAFMRGIYETIDGREMAMVLVHGGARGADTLAGKACNKINEENKALRLSPIIIEEVEAQWDEFGKAAGVIRNGEMLRKFPIDLAFAFHDDLENSKGTKDMVKKLADAEIPTYHIRRLT